MSTDSSTSYGGSQAEQDIVGGLDRNIAGAACYVLGFITGVIFYALEDDEFVQFHAMQSIIVFGGLVVLNVVINLLVPVLGTAAGTLSMVVNLLGLALWAFLMYKAYNGEAYELPGIGEKARELT